MNILSKVKKKLSFILILSILVSLEPLIAEQNKDNHRPEAYTYEEFPLWQHELRRFEIITFGALPFVTLFSFWGYDGIRYFQHRRDVAYAPWPFKSSEKYAQLTSKEMTGVFFTALGISIGIGIIDISYRAIKRSIRFKKLERENLVQEAVIQFEEIPDEVPATPNTQKKENSTATETPDNSADNPKGTNDHAH